MNFSELQTNLPSMSKEAAIRELKIVFQNLNEMYDSANTRSETYRKHNSPEMAEFWNSQAIKYAEQMSEILKMKERFNA